MTDAAAPPNASQGPAEDSPPGSPDAARSAGQATHRPAGRGGLRQRIAAAYEQEVGPGEQSLLIAWAGFAATFGVTRAVTHLLRRMSGGGGMSAGGRHLHHYNLGIALLGGVGGVALRGAEKHRHHPVTAAAYGAGAALIVDEFALLFDLQDVYWAKDGRKSVDAAVAVIAGGGAYLVAMPFWHGAVQELLGRPPRS